MSGCRGDPAELEKKIWAYVEQRRGEQAKSRVPATDAERLLAEARRLRETARELLKKARELEEAARR
jgi:hypothetical protein